MLHTRNLSSNNFFVVTKNVAKVQHFPTTCNMEPKHAKLQRVVVIRVTSHCNLKRNNVAKEVAEICCLYYFTFK